MKLHKLKSEIAGFNAEISTEEKKIVLKIPFSKPQTDKDVKQFIAAWTTTKGYVQRTKELVEENRKVIEEQFPGRTIWSKYYIIDYPLEDTIAVKFRSTNPNIKTRTMFWKHVMEKHGAEVRLVKYVKNGTIIAYHFKD